VTLTITTQAANGPHTIQLTGWQSFTLAPDDEVKISSLSNTATGFIAIGGGVPLPPTMGSLSTYIRSELGGLEGRFLQSGDLLPLSPEAAARAHTPDQPYPTPPSVPSQTVRVVLGPQDDYFTPAALDRFLNTPYQISKASDRMGARLDGAALEHIPEKGAEIISDGVIAGAIQVPGTAQPIVLLNDGQTVGGYPKIATVISCDLPLIANALPDTSLTFQAVTAQEACEDVRAHHKQLEAFKKTCVIVNPKGFINMKALYETNLIGGVVDMACPDHFAGHLTERPDS